MNNETQDLRRELRQALATIVRLERERAGFQMWVNEVAELFKGKSPQEMMEEVEGLRREITVLHLQKLRTEEAWTKKLATKQDT